MPPSENWLAFLCINLAFAGAALSIGFFAGAWFLGGRRKPAPEPAAESDRRTLTLERTAASSDRLRDLAVGMVSDIGEHSSRVREVTLHLESLDLNDIHATGAGLVAAMAEIVTANNQLHQQLTEAESQIKAQAAEIRSYELEARTDALTTLANRRAFDDELARRFSEWQRKATTFSLLILDLDHFKQLNDTFGHQGGDQVLRAIGTKLKSTCRSMDLPCRYGGEEFAVVMPATQAKEAMLFAERLRSAIEKTPVEINGTHVNVTCSMGVAQVLRSDDIVRTLRRADEALYQSKAAGRNCIHLHDGEQCITSAGKAAALPPATTGPRPATHTTNTLDNLPNRTRFVDELRRRIAESHRTGQALCVISVRLGSYGDIRRNLGSTSVAIALEEAAKRLIGTLRESDLVAQLNDQTFAIMMPGSTEEEATLMIERVWAALDVCDPFPEGPVHGLNPLLGLAALQPADSVESLIRRAENDLLAAEDLRQACVNRG